MNDLTFVRCNQCGKKLIGRLPNGLWYFVFGRKVKRGGELSTYCPVEIYIHGSLKIRCIARGCEHWNILNYFPSDQVFRHGEDESTQSACVEL